jgi:exonuclease III
LIDTAGACAGAELKRLQYRTEKWDMELAAYINRLREQKDVVVTGDFNCAREPIDIHCAKRNVKSAGFTPEERASFQKVRSRQL